MAWPSSAETARVESASTCRVLVPISRRWNADKFHEGRSHLSIRAGFARRVFWERPIGLGIQGSTTMRKTIAGAFISLDGVMQAPGGPEEDPTGGFAYGGWTVP